MKDKSHQHHQIWSIIQLQKNVYELIENEYFSNDSKEHQLLNYIKSLDLINHNCPIDIRIAKTQ